MVLKFRSKDETKCSRKILEKKISRKKKKEKNLKEPLSYGAYSAPMKSVLLNS